MAAVGATPENNTLIKRLTEDGYFEEEGDVAKFAFAFAIKNDLELEYPDYVPKNITTKWAYEQFDKDQLMRGLVSIKYPDEEDIIGKIQQLVNLGLHVMAEKIGNASDPILTQFIVDEPDSRSKRRD